MDKVGINAPSGNVIHFKSVERAAELFGERGWDVTIGEDVYTSFGRFGGCDTVYNDLKPSGARVIELTEGEPGFRSWIRIYGEGITQDLNYPEDFKTVL